MDKKVNENEAKESKVDEWMPKSEKDMSKKKTVEDRVQQLFVRAGKTDFNDPAAVKEFEVRFKKKIDRKPYNGILFRVAHKATWPKEAHWSDEKTGEFLNWALKNYHKLLEVPAPSDQVLMVGMPPLHVALVQDNVAFVNAVLKFPKLMNLATILAAEDKEGNHGNAIQIAVRYSLSSIEPLVDRCYNSPELFGNEKKEVQTPLHKCMSLDLSSQEDDRNHESDSGENSSTGSSDDSDDSSLNENSAKPNNRDGTYSSGSLRNRQMGNPSVRQSGNSSKTPKISDILKAVKKLVRGCDSVLWYRNAGGRTPYLERLHHLEQDAGKKFLDREAQKKLSKQESRQNDPEEEAHKEILEQESHQNDLVEARKNDFEQFLHNIIANDEIASFIRSYCIRNFSRDKIMESLYYVGEERHIEFDLGGVPNDEISEEYLRQLSKHLKFESILRYVALPKLTLEAPPRIKQGKQRNNKAGDERGRSDLVTVFNWLRDNGVRQILKVIVVDDRDPCHANSSIEKALQGFEIEVWDWKKLDLSLDVIYKTTGVVREISLYCSGNNAVLTGWASAKGLSNKQFFPNLEHITLYIRQGYDSRERLLEYIQEFKDSIQEVSSKSKAITIDHIVDDGPISYASEFQSSTGFLQPKNSWIECVKRLSRFLATAKKPKGMRRVKVAIIDDGVDASMSELDGRIAAGKSFSPYANSKDLMSPYFVSSSNHGTCMALLICELCPEVELYVAKLDQREVIGSNQRHITTTSAVEAFQWATKCGVHIISTSWTIETPVAGNPDMKKLEKVVKNAADKKILIFCSTSDQGSQTKDYCFPGDFSDCIKIGSATDTGDAMTWVNTEKVHYLLPGVNIPFPSSKSKTETHNESGSSVATAAASGLASLLIFASWLLNEKDIFFQEYRNMNQAFKNLARGKKYLSVTELLEKQFLEKLSKIQNQGPDHSHDTLATLTWNDDCKTALEQVLERIRET